MASICGHFGSMVSSSAAVAPPPGLAPPCSIQRGLRRTEARRERYRRGGNVRRADARPPPITRGQVPTFAPTPGLPPTKLGQEATLPGECLPDDILRGLTSLPPFPCGGSFNDSVSPSTFKSSPNLMKLEGKIDSLTTLVMQLRTEILDHIRPLPIPP